MADPLTADDILRNLPGWWGYVRDGSSFDGFACDAAPQRIWIEGDVYSEQRPKIGIGRIEQGKLTVPEAARGEQADHLVLTYTSPRATIDGVPIAKFIRMLDRNTLETAFVNAPAGTMVLVRCPSVGIG